MKRPPCQQGGPAPPRRVSLLLAALLGLAVAIGACAHPGPAPLARTFESPEALAEAVLDALAARDGETLAALPLSQAEFRHAVWPELPASRPEVNLPVEYAWSSLHLKSRGSLQALVRDWGGRRLTLVRLAFAGETTRYATFAVHRETVLTVRDDGGRERDVRLFGSILERDGRYKLFSYVVN